ncbi:3-oxoacyl-ACP synthase [Mucilaginibacter panaciglaebae]|uniref:3-oxoacyl-ACP synthase n=1 Tax=Mucilaginibacter panaciglaebae TaxID=502331 RepID=A0ABP7X3H0_9SPHI
MNQLKQLLYQQCLDYVQQRMDAAQQGIDEAQQASKEDTKSSAGDKYETGRAMMQQETDRNMAQLTEANKLKVALNQINPAVNNDRAETGSIVITNLAKFYISISAGALSVNGDTYMAISPASPIGLKMKGLKAGDEFNLNGKAYKIESIL